MIKKIIHCADIHIRNIKRHDEYKNVIGKFIDECKEIMSEYSYDEVRIVIVGDIFHQKIQTSNEQTELFYWFISELEKLCPVILTAGNHDFMLNNKDRLDSITPIIKLMNLKNVKYLDYINEYKSGFIVDDNVVWSLYSIFDNSSIPDFYSEKLNNPDKKFVGLFHGMLNGSTTDVGVTFDSGYPVSMFEGCDLVLCGDIHKRQELNFKDIKIAYPGSLIQQDFGENVSGHGFLVWDLESLDYEEYDIESEYGFYKFKISSIEDIEQQTEEFINF